MAYLVVYKCSQLLLSLLLLFELNKYIFFYSIYGKFHSSHNYIDLHLTRGDPLDSQVPPGSERSMRTSSPRTLGSTRHGGRLETGRSGIKSSVRQRSVRSSPPRRRELVTYSDFSDTLWCVYASRYNASN